MKHSSLTQAMAMSTTVQARQPVIVKVKNSYKEKNNINTEYMKMLELQDCLNVKKLIKKGKPRI